jgi:phosphotransferase system, enzyme I, PtsP
MHVIEHAHAEGKPVSVCGEMAGDPASALMLMAMGVDTLSMNASHLLRVKAAIRKMKITAARKLLYEVLAMDNGEVIASYIGLQLDKAGLGDLISHRRAV